MNIQQLIEMQNNPFNAPQHHHAFDESFESCIKCTACTAVCPVSRQNQTIQVQNNQVQMVSVYA